MGNIYFRDRGGFVIYENLGNWNSSSRAKKENRKRKRKGKRREKKSREVKG